jgi:two-component system sensor histidine kinase UhpB
VVEEALAGLVTSLLSYLGPTQDSGELPLPPVACLQCYNNVYVLGLLARLARQVREAQEQEERLRRLSAQVMRAQEEERKRVARELHDDTAQALTALLVHLRVLENSAPDDETRRRLRELRELTSSTLEGVRRLALDLRPSALDHFGLTAALAASAEEFSKRWGIPVHLPPDVELALYRTTQEALSNVAKHARASRVSIALRRLGERLVLRVEDDGKGFRPEEVMASRERGLGLFGMQERLALVGGSLEIRSRPGAGTEVLAQVPLARPRPDRVHAHEGTHPPGG